MARGRRWLRNIPILTRRPWEDVAQNLEDFLRSLWASESDGVPSGFENKTPTTVEAGLIGDPGNESEGWAAADHDHVALTGTGTALTPTSVNAEGIATTLARSDHSHDTSALVDEAMIFAIIFGGK